MPGQAHRQLGLFDNPIGVFAVEHLAETIRALDHQRPGQTVDELTDAVFTELAL